MFGKHRRKVLGGWAHGMHASTHVCTKTYAYICKILPSGRIPHRLEPVGHVRLKLLLELQKQTKNFSKKPNAHP
jgi:hypothetical protein